MTKTFHITNGSSLTQYLYELDVKGDVLTWQEMLCEGPTEVTIDSESFINKRNTFLSNYYDIEINEEAFKNEISKLDAIHQYSEIVLWFEYDLFCHINLIAVISLIQQKQIKLPLYLVCSGRVEGEKNLKGLSELTPEQLLSHCKNRIKLTNDDIEIATTVWKTYCGKDHNLLKPYITKNSSFEYLGCCLKAHLKRFPDSRTGLSTLEFNVLNIVNTYDIKSKHHLLGYALNYQGYYGFGDLQLNRIIENLSDFFEEIDETLTLNRLGHEALLSRYNNSDQVNNDMYLGGVNRLDFQFNKQQNKLIKTILNAY